MTPEQKLKEIVETTKDHLYKIRVGDYEIYRKEYKEKLILAECLQIAYKELHQAEYSCESDSCREECKKAINKISKKLDEL